MPLPVVALGSLGGTITMTVREGGATPRLDANHLVEAVPELGRLATVDAVTLASLPSASLSFDAVLAALSWADKAVDDGARGVVIVQGTDTMEETAYLLDLYWGRDEPLVLTGAMRTAGAAGADGPANLLTAVRAAAAPECRRLGVLVAMNDEVHAAARVRKIHATSPAAFASPVFGPVAVVREGHLVVGNRPGRVPTLPLPACEGPRPRVALIEACLDDDGGLLQLASASGYSGAVVSAFGVGHVHAAMAAVIEEVGARMPVVFATRTGAGSTLSRTYGFVGSEADLIARGAVPAGWLDPRKARVLLWSLLASGATIEQIRVEFRQRADPHSMGARFTHARSLTRNPKGS